MKNKITLTLILVFSIFEICKAQKVDFYGKKIDVSNLCNSLGFSDDSEAKNYLNQICAAAGIRSNFIMFQCNNIGTCLAIEKDGDPYILYDNEFLNKLKSKISYGFSEKKINIKSYEENDWISMTILAHEIGHHENHHFSKTIRAANSIKDLELQADEYAGHVLYSLGATLQQGEKVFHTAIIPTEGSIEHPSRTDRVKAFEEGYNKEKLRFSNFNLIENSSSSINTESLILGSWIDDKNSVVMTFFDNARFQITQNEKVNEGQWNLADEVLSLKNIEATTSVKLRIIGINAYVLSLIRGDNDILTLQRTSHTAIISAKEYLIKNWSKYIYIDKFNFTSRKIGGIWDVNVPLVNNSDYVLDLIRVKVDYIKDSYLASGDIYKSEFIDFKNIQPHTTQVIKAPDSDRGTGIQTSIIIIHSNVMNMN